jgi:nucleotide-binding universal stress UspA family protein
MQSVHILLPLDDHAFSGQIYEQIIQLFPPETTRLTLLHVHTPAPPIHTALRYSYGEKRSDHSSDAFDKEGLDVEAHQRKVELEADATHFRTRGYTVTVMLRVGQVVDEIVACVEQEQPQLIAMVTHGHSGLGQIIFGSTAQAVMSQVEIPVLMLRRSES